MKERPILFSSPMVRAILAGTKTQTRRIVKPQPTLQTTLVEWNTAEVAFVPWNWASHGGHRTGQPIACPQGVPGDRLWVRETWEPYPDSATLASHPLVDGKRIVYAADCIPNAAPLFRWRPSIFMPRAASRITLDVVSVRVERLQAITDADIAAEGVSAEALHGLGVDYNVDNTTPRDMWAIGWDAINGKRASWGSNPWVWVIGFARVTS